MPVVSDVVRQIRHGVQINKGLYGRHMCGLLIELCPVFTRVRDDVRTFSVFRAP